MRCYHPIAYKELDLGDLMYLLSLLVNVLFWCQYVFGLPLVVLIEFRDIPIDIRMLSFYNNLETQLQSYLLAYMFSHKNAFILFEKKPRMHKPVYIG